MSQVITHTPEGVYSTITLSDGVVETCLFRNDGSTQVVGRTVLLSMRGIQAQHIEEWRARR